MEQAYRRKKTTVSLIHYHFVFCPRYRRKIFLDPLVEKRFKEIVSEVCQSLDVEVIGIECNVDNTHLFLGAPPQLSPSDIVAKIKYVSSRKIRQEFEQLNRAVSLWTRSYFVSTEGEAPPDTISDFIAAQKKRG